MQIFCKSADYLFLVIDIMYSVNRPLFFLMDRLLTPFSQETSFSPINVGPHAQQQRDQQLRPPVQKLDLLNY